MTRRIGVVSVIVTDCTTQAGKVHDVTSEFGDVMIGRMGRPYRAPGVHISALIIDGTTDEAGALTGKRGTLEGVTVKASVMKA